MNAPAATKFSGQSGRLLKKRAMLETVLGATAASWAILMAISVAVGVIRP
jgi:hypothetical protein